jgi:hypothetical protein
LFDRWKTLLKIFPLFLVILLTLGKPSIAEDTPEWVVKGPGVFKDGSLYAVGIAQGKKPMSMLVRTADNRARANLAASIKTTVQAMTEDFEGSTISTDEMVTRILVYDGSVEVTDVKGAPETLTVLGPGEKMMVVVGEGFGFKESFESRTRASDWNDWENNATPFTE